MPCGWEGNRRFGAIIIIIIIIIIIGLDIFKVA